MIEIPKRLAVAAAVCWALAPAVAGADRTSAPSTSATGSVAAPTGAGKIDLTTWDQAALREGYSAARLLDMEAQGRQGEEIGDVQDILVDRNGKVTAIVVSHGGVFGIGDKTLRVPMDEVKIGPRLESVVLPIDKENVAKYRVEEDRKGGRGELHVSEMLKGPIELRGGARYGSVEDAIIGRDGRIQAIVVDVNDTTRRGAYAVPWREDAYDPAGRLFTYDYARSDIDNLRPFDYSALGITPATSAGATSGGAAEGKTASSSGGSGDSAEALAKAKGCMNCHALDKKKVGPSFKDIAAKYKGKPDTVPTLTSQLKAGKGHPKQSASEADLRKILDDFVLKQ